jgi:hypothetical protein
MVVGWLDNWHPLCVLLDRFGYRAVYDSHSWLNAKQCIIGLPRVTACWLGDSKETLVVCFAEAVQKALTIYFFSCGFSSRIWKTCFQRCNILNPPTRWDDVLVEGCT